MEHFRLNFNFDDKIDELAKQAKDPINYCYNQCSGVILRNIFSIVLNKMMSCQFQKNTIRLFQKRNLPIFTVII